MKLHELEPHLDPRKPLRFAGLSPRAVTAPAAAAAESIRIDRPSTVAADALESFDLAAIDRACAVLAAHPALKHDTAERRRALARELDTRPQLSELRFRAQRAVSLFTGASTGVLVALWEQESAQLNAELRADLLSRWTELGNARRAPDFVSSAGKQFDGKADPSLEQLRSALQRVRSAVHALEQFDALDRAFTAHSVIALSPRAGLAVSGGRALPTARLERPFSGRASWGEGIVWLPQRAALIGWTSGTGGTQLFELSAAALVRWIESLGTGSLEPLRWEHHLIPVHARLSDRHEWHELATAMTRLMQFGQTPLATPTAAVSRPAVQVGPARRRTPVTVPVTRFVITATEAHSGVEPVDLATGAAPDDSDWIASRFRNTWSPEQNRYLKVWMEAYWQRAGRPPIEPILVTVLP